MRDTSTLMVAQYFKRKRETVEVIVLLTSQDALKMMSTSTIDIMRGVFIGPESDHWECLSLTD